MGLLTGKTAVVTGGSSGIGLEISRVLARAGARVVIFGRRRQVLEEAAASIGNGADFVEGDVTRVADIERLFDHVRTKYGRLQILVANAGSAGGGSLTTGTEQEFDDLMALNLKGVFFTVKNALPLLEAPASVVVVGSVASAIALPGGSVYSASKAAVRSFVRTWGVELAPAGIRVNLLAPGITETPLLDRLQSREGGQEGFDRLIAERTPMGRRGRPEEVAAAALFLCSPQSSYTTGGVLYVDGGLAQM
jgi:NAD(P)-dependent dehydrogenase (short-subunit alcohol dehydrogenase family)